MHFFAFFCAYPLTNEFFFVTIHADTLKPFISRLVRACQSLLGAAYKGF